MTLMYCVTDSDGFTYYKNNFSGQENSYQYLPSMSPL